jgi:hypothetical protein
MDSIDYLFLAKYLHPRPTKSSVDGRGKHREDGGGGEDGDSLSRCT